MEIALPRKSNKSTPIGLTANVLITVFVVVAMMGLSRLAPGYAWAVAAIGLLGLGVFFYLAGGRKR